MTIKTPSPSQIRELALSVGLDLEPDEIEEYGEALSDINAVFEVLDALPEPLPEVKYPRTPGRFPTIEENPHNAWYVKTAIKGADEGKLAGRTVVLKDTVCLAGVPMMNGASFLEHYVPNVDASIVTRILDAGGEIVGKANCEYLSFSGGSHTCANGPVHNPRKRGYSAGGSSSGSTALVAAREVDLAIGGDQGGSIRIPASFCGTCGMKPTFGLVPYSGIMGIEYTLDHIGPITANVADNALFLEVLAGNDGIDTRQPPRLQPVSYTGAKEEGAEGLRVAVVREGFGSEGGEEAVDGAVRAAAESLAGLGANVEEVSVPMHLVAGAIAFPIFVEGGIGAILQNGFGAHQEGLGITSLVDRFASFRDRTHELPPNVVTFLLYAKYLQEYRAGYYYAKSQNLRRQLSGAYDAILERHDLLLMPTTSMAATPLPGPDASKAEIIQRAFEPIANTAAFNVTGHPAMSMPCGDTDDGRPIGLMLVGRHFDELTIYRAAYALENG
ncbi:MAG: amidase [Gammaproteobacteria bacterium]|nr:amidase [Gammaproteobacteria bacterium]